METASSDLAQLQSDLASKKAIAENDTAGLTDAAREKMAITSNLSELKSKNLQELLEEGRKGIQAEFKGVISDAKVTQAQPLPREWNFSPCKVHRMSAWKPMYPNTILTR